MAPIINMDSHHHSHQPSWPGDGRSQTRGGGGSSGSGAYAPQQQWPGPGGSSQMHIGGPIVLARDIMADGGFAASAHHSIGARSPLMSRGGRVGAGLQAAPMMGGSRDLLGEGTFMGRGYSIKRCQGFVRCDMDIDAEVVGWVIGKNGSTIKDMKHKTGCNMWVDQRALKLTITGPDLSSVEHAAKSVDAYVAAAPIKAGAVEAAVTKTLECPPHLLDMLGDRTTIARIVKETHAQVVVNKKIGRIIVRGDHRSVELACQSVHATIQAALHGGLGLRVNTPDSGNGGSYFSGPGPVGTPGGLMSPGDGGGMSGMMNMLPTHGGPDYGVVDVPEFRSLDTWQAQQLELQMQPPLHPIRRHHGRGSDSDESEIEIETVSLGSIGARTPVSSAAGSPRLVVPHVSSLTASPASVAASTPGGDWSLFSGGFGLGMAALAENSSCASTPTTTTARATPRVHFPEDLQSLALGSSAVLGSSVDSGEATGENKDGSVGGGTGVIGAHAPPPSPASTTSGENARKVRSVLADAYALDALAGSDDEGDEGDVEEKVARLGKCLTAMGLGKYCSKFAENEVDLEALGLMTEGDLADIGIPKGPRLKILNAVSQRGSHSQHQNTNV